MFCVTTLCQVELIGKTFSLLLANIINLTSFLKNTPKNWCWEVLFTTGIKGFLVGVYYTQFLVCILELIFFYSKNRNLSWSCFIDGANMLTNIITPRHYKNTLSFSRFGDGEGCVSITVCWYLFGLRLLIIGIIIIFVCINPWKILLLFFSI